MSLMSLSVDLAQLRKELVIGWLNYPKRNAKRKKSKKQNRTKVQDLWHNVKCSNMCIIGIPEEETFEDIKADMFPKIIWQTANHCSKKVR